jgi:hypothetical protein
VNEDEMEQLAAAITPADSPLTMREIMNSDALRDLRTPDVSVGDAAVDFTLSCYDFTHGLNTLTRRTVTLSDHAGVQPVAMIFGSYT